MKSQGIKNDTTYNQFAAHDFDNIDKGRPHELITLKKFNDAEKYDEFNYERKILVFKDANTKKVIKEIDIVEANPFHKQGFKRRIEPDKENFSYFIMKKGNENKFQMRDFLPNEIFDEIPNDFPLVRAIIRFPIKIPLINIPLLPIKLNGYLTHMETMENGMDQDMGFNMLKFIIQKELKYFLTNIVVLL
ncbi:MAG: hypothetical protein IPQ04_04375 [Saprospiraceae bacterium]|nr:hypothetical protein [Saprospiraceae bacterium]